MTFSCYQENLASRGTMSKGYTTPTFEAASLGEDNRACQRCLGDIRDSWGPKAACDWVLPMANTNYISPLPVKEGMAAIMQARTTRGYSLPTLLVRGPSLLLGSSRSWLSSAA